MNRWYSFGAVILIGGLFVLFFFLWQGRDAENEPTGAAQREEEINADEYVEEEDAEEHGFLDEEVLLTPAAEVSQADCDNECEGFQNDGEKLRYCQAYCGLSPTPGAPAPPPENCDRQSGLERDTCIKDEAVRGKNIERCSDIQDSALKKSCRNRVTEDYFP